jgi:hypothetical protein
MNIVYVVSLSVLISCSSKAQMENHIIVKDTVLVDTVLQVDIVPIYKTFDRTQIKANLSHKIAQDTPLVVHVLVPLCDNIHQGIVPTTKSLGDGFSLRTNLYWATSHGMKRYFKELTDWKLLSSQIFHPDSVILERVVFEKKYSNGTKVRLIADAYRGDKIENCLLDFFNALSGTLTDTVFIDNDIIFTHSKADLVVYNGHNGLMDVWVDDVVNVDGVQKDAAVIACSSQYDFNEKLNYAKAYPLVMTTNALYPGSFILEAVINNWAMQESEEIIRQSAGNAYHRIKRCGINGARNLFSTGW